MYTQFIAKGVSAIRPTFLFLALSLTVSSQTEVLTNSKVIDLVRAGIGESVLIPKIRSSRIVMDASQAALLELKAAGVPDIVVVAMLDRAAVSGRITDARASDNLVDLPAGTEIRVITKEKISGRKVKPGDEFAMETAEDLLADGAIVIAKGTPVKAIVSEAKSPGMAGRSGRLSIYIVSTTAVDGQNIQLRSAKSGKGGDRFGTAIALSYLWGIGLLIPGKNAEIKAGTLISAFTDKSEFIVVGAKGT